MSFLRTGLLLDLNNLYFAAQDKYGRRVQITDYVKHLESLGHTLTYRIAYSRQKASECQPLVSMLKWHGFETNFGNTSWAVAMALRAADIVPNIDSLVLGSNYQECGRILAWAKAQGKLTTCFAIGIPEFFGQFCKCLEVPEELLSEANKTA